MKVIIIGGGLVGSLTAVFMGQREHDVNLYEYRDDPRKAVSTVGRSINLALSERGRKALRTVGLEEKVLDKAVPMYGRMIHNIDGRQSSIAYDPVHNNCIYSVGRKLLNEILLNESTKLPNVHLNFGTKLIKVDPSAGVVTLQKKDEGSFATEEEAADLIVGADGAYSTVRRDLMKSAHVNFSQTYIDHGYLELSIPSRNAQKMAPNHLHIWPRGQFMMIALPNHDQSWTVTLFMPLGVFKSFRTSKDILEFFQTHFNDSIDLIEPENLINTFVANKPSHLVSIKCSKYHESNVIIIGDAAHAMVPFYGQGMNAGFEDCSILDDLLHNHGNSLVKALGLFSKNRNPDAEAICDLAMYNYVEMRDLVNRRSFLIRKFMDNFLYRTLNDKWLPLYQSVTFTNLHYRRCLENKKWQDAMIMRLILLVMALIVVVVTCSYFSNSQPALDVSLEKYCRAS